MQIFEDFKSCSVKIIFEFNWWGVSELEEEYKFQSSHLYCYIVHLGHIYKQRL